MTDSLKNNGNILLVANWESNVGYAWWLMENFWITIAESFLREGVKSHLIYPKITKIPQGIAATDIKTSELDFSDHGFDNLIYIYRFIKANDIRYIYLSDYPTYSWFYFFLRTAGIKKIVVHDHTPGERSKPAYWLKIIKNIVQRIPFYTADHFIAVTDYVNERHLGVNCIPEKKCSVASNGIQPYDLGQADATYANRNFDIPDDRVIVVTTGRASYYKGIDFFIHCAHELVNVQNHRQLHFLFCGDGPDMD
ncbi:MAG: glycosyltransferase family 4 protein, partial [Gammaproteobacteria bacterium]|nr:glycosyltransferase family 4 protein [Gammaproteobacteria bacterium]